MNDITAPNNKVVINYPSYIVDSFASYLVGSPIVYDGEEEIKQILEYNDVADVDLETVTDSNIFGYGITAELPLSLEVADGAQARIDIVVLKLFFNDFFTPIITTFFSCFTLILQK